MPVKLFFNYKSLLLAGLVLNIAVIIYVYFIVGGGPASMKQSGDWMAIFNEVPLTFLFFLAAVFKPYLMVWSKCRKYIDVVFTAGMVMLATTAISSLIILLAKQTLTQDLTMYVNRALLWGTSTYFVLAPKQDPTIE
jgi:hypothetical protein